MKFKLEISDEEAKKLGGLKTVKEVSRVYTLDGAREEFKKNPEFCKERLKCNNPEELFKFWKGNLLRDSNADRLYTVNLDGSITNWEYNYYIEIFTLEELMRIVEILKFPVIGMGIISTEME